MSAAPGAPTSRIMTALLRLAGLAAVLAALAGCGGGSEAGPVAAGRPLALGELAAAARTSAEAASGRFAFAFTVSGEGLGEPLAFSGEGAFDAAAKRAAVTLDLSSFGALLGGLVSGLGAGEAPELDDPAAWRFELVQDGEATYVRAPVLAGRLPTGKSWVRSERVSGSALPGLDLGQLEQLAGGDPRTLLEALEAVSGRVEVVGVEELRGVAVTHYRATIDAAAAASGDGARAPLAGELLEQAGLASLPLDVWLDGAGLVRKLALVARETRPGTAERAQAAITFELWDYGEDVEIELPPAVQVADAATLGP